MGSRTHDLDVIILGQGLVGSLLAWRLLQRGQRVLVIDDGHRSAASRAAAGLINPLAGLRFSIPPRVRAWLSHSKDTYAQLETELATRLYYPRDMLRLFRSPAQRERYARRAAQAEAWGLVRQTVTAEAPGEPVVAPCGGVLQSGTGHLEVALLLDRLQPWLCARGAYQRRPVNYAEIHPDAKGVRLGDLRAHRLVCCEGRRVLQNPWFAHLPWRCNQGELLRLRADGPLPQRIVNGAHWIIPLADGSLRLGATHDPARQDEQTTPGARAQLLDGLQALLGHRPTLQVLEQRGGVRPGVRDAAPILGQHPNAPGLWLCNGFGARGSLTAPWYTDRLVAHWLDDRPLPDEARLQRFS